MLYNAQCINILVAKMVHTYINKTDNKIRNNIIKNNKIDIQVKQNVFEIDNINETTARF